MKEPSSHRSARGLLNLSRFIFGTTRLGDPKIPVAERIAIARAAMDSGVWFHTSRQYGDALEVLRRAFDGDRSRVPRLIVKIGHNDLAELRANIRDNITPLGVDHVDLGQLCLGGRYAEEFRSGGNCFDDFRRLKDEGLVRHFVMEVFPWTSRVPLEALKGGYSDGIIDGLIFYFNPLQRFVSNALWDLIRERQVPIVAMRTLCGAPVHALRDVPGAAWMPYLQERSVEVARIFEGSGVKDWAEFCMRFAFSFSQVRATVGSTSQKPHLDSFIALGNARSIAALPQGLLDELLTLQRRWADEVDARADPWTM